MYGFEISMENIKQEVKALLRKGYATRELAMEAAKEYIDSLEYSVIIIHDYKEDIPESPSIAQLQEHNKLLVNDSLYGNSGYSLMKQEFEQYKRNTSSTLQVLAKAINSIGTQTGTLRENTVAKKLLDELLADKEIDGE